MREEASEREKCRGEKKNRRNDVTGIERARERERYARLKKKKRRKEEKERKAKREGWKRRNAQENRSEKCIRGGRGSR